MSRKEIFIVENDEEILDVLNLILEKDYEIHLYKAPDDHFLKEVKKFNPELFILDWLIPNHKVEELVGPLKESHPNAKIMVISAHEKVMNAFANRGQVDTILPKPFGATELRSAIKNTLLQ